MQTTRGMCSLLAPSSLSVLRWPNPAVLLHQVPPLLSVEDPLTGGPSKSPKIRVMPCSVFVISPHGMWKVWVSGLHWLRSGSPKFTAPASTRKSARRRNYAYRSSQRCGVWVYGLNGPRLAVGWRESVGGLGGCRRSTSRAWGTLDVAPS